MGDGRRGVVRIKPELYKKAVRTPVHTYMNMYTQASYMHRYTDVLCRGGSLGLGLPMHSGKEEAAGWVWGDRMDVR